MGVSTALRTGEARRFSAEERLEAAFSLAGGKAGLHSSKSPVRETPNEDSATVIAMGEDCGVLAVADGLGGAPGRQQASALAVKCLVEAVRNATREGHDARWGILNGFETANEQVLALGMGAATTLTVAEVGGKSVRAYHVGDSQVIVTGQRGKLKAADDPPFAPSATVSSPAS